MNPTFDRQHSLKALTVATDLHDPQGGGGVDLLMDSCRACGLDLKVLGLGRPWRGFGMKLRLVFEEIAGDHPNSLVLFLDAFDVLALPAAKEIVRRFLSFSAPIVAGAEMGCWPVKDLAARYPPPLPRQPKCLDTRIANLRPVPPFVTPFKYLNSGCYIGYVWALREAIEEMAPEDQDDDQDLLTEYYLRHPERVALDHLAELFLNLFGLTVNDVEVSAASVPWLTCKWTASTPCMIHGNGWGREPFKRIVNRLHHLGWPPGAT